MRVLVLVKPYEAAPSAMPNAIDWARRAPMGEADLELRPFLEPGDFEGIATPEMIDEEKRWREDQLAKAPQAG